MWDEGGSLLFADGLSLPKAPGYQNYVPQVGGGGKPAWTAPPNGTPGAIVCANKSGQIEWVKPPDE
jgi:hypothetical protein